ncbi:MAG: DUF2619 domain-containing protein [Bacillota bacterium]
MYGFINFSAAYLIFRGGTAEEGLKINAIVGAIGPFILTTVTFIGLTGAASKLSFAKILL